VSSIASIGNGPPCIHVCTSDSKTCRLSSFVLQILRYAVAAFSTPFGRFYVCAHYPLAAITQRLIIAGSIPIKRAAVVPAIRSMRNRRIKRWGKGKEPNIWRESSSGSHVQFQSADKTQQQKGGSKCPQEIPRSCSRSSPRSAICSPHHNALARLEIFFNDLLLVVAGNETDVAQYAEQLRLAIIEEERGPVLRLHPAARPQQKSPSNHVEEAINTLFPGSFRRTINPHRSIRPAQPKERRTSSWSNYFEHAPAASKRRHPNPSSIVAHLPLNWKKWHRSTRPGPPQRGSRSHISIDPDCSTHTGCHQPHHREPGSFH